ncbi:hypothetical protein RRG08_058466 [Elysia crispata]|uniref:Uncharacterized protein n=1 Tax=Elysia crispata TaxID=231223 RepID=A0AAE1CTU2_9GAST|nr:hypothetical protein RRG08_058466 [Elysia crispata]
MKVFVKSISPAPVTLVQSRLGYVEVAPGIRPCRMLRAWAELPTPSGDAGRARPTNWLTSPESPQWRHRKMGIMLYRIQVNGEHSRGTITGLYTCSPETIKGIPRWLEKASII